MSTNPISKKVNISPGRYRNILKNGLPFCEINFTDKDTGEYLATYGVFFRHKRFDSPGVFWKPPKGRRRDYARPEWPIVPRAYTKCLLLRLNKFEPFGFLGKAECSWNDQFSKAAGRQVALSRAIPARFNVTVADLKQVTETGSNYSVGIKNHTILGANGSFTEVKPHDWRFKKFIHRDF